MSFGVPLRNGLSLGLLSTSSLAPSARYTELIAPNLLYPPLTLTRAQTGGALSTAVQADGATLATFGADVARFNGVERRLLIEGQRTNNTYDPRTIGSTGWSNTGVTRSAINGPSGVSGDASRLTESSLLDGHFSFATGVASVSTGTSYTLSMLVKPGTCTMCQLSPSFSLFGSTAFANFDLTGAGALGTLGAGVSRAAIRQIGDWYRIEMTTTPTSSGSGSPIGVFLIDSLTATRAPFYLGTGRTLDAAWAQMEQAAFASSPILPPVGTPGASTRGDDRIEAPLSSFGIGGSGVCTVLWSGLVYATGVGVEQCFVALDDGTGNNSYRLRNLLAGPNVQIVSVNGGVVTGVGLGVLTVNTVFRLGMTVAGGGIARASFNGGTPVGVTAGPTAGLTTLRVNNAVSGAGVYGAPVFGENATFSILPYALSDADLQAAVAALPT